MQPYDENMLEEKPRNSASEDRYKTLFERINAAAFLASFEGQILEANQKSYEDLGYDWNELLRLSLQDILVDTVDWVQVKDELAARGCMMFESEGICKDGTRIPVDVSISIFRMSGRLMMFTLLWDITERKRQEERLKESEKKYHGLFEYTTDGIIVLDAHGEIFDVNTRMCEMLDVMKSDMLRKNLFSMYLLTAKSLPVVIQQFEQLLSQKTATSYTTEIKNSHDQVMQVEISSFFLVKKDNEVDNFVLIVRNITARNTAEKKRVEEHEMFRALLDTIPDPVSFKDENLRFILVNKAKAGLSNVSPEAMVGTTEFDWLPTEQAQRVSEDDTMVLRSGVSVVNRAERLSGEGGALGWALVTKVPRYNEDGDIIGTLGVFRDVTEWKRTEDELVCQQRLLQTLLDAVPAEVAFKDNEHRFVLVNKTKASALGTYPEAMAGKTDFDFLPREAAEKSLEGDEAVIRTGRPTLASAEKVTRADGSERWVSVTRVPRFDLDGHLVGTLEISWDVKPVSI